MSSTLFLDERDLVQLTGWKLKSRQVQWLRDAGIPFRVNATGHPVVTRAAIEGRQPAEQSAPQPNAWTPRVVGGT